MTAAMRANDVHSTEILRHGAYLCLGLPPGTPGAPQAPVEPGAPNVAHLPGAPDAPTAPNPLRAVAGAAVPALAERLGLRNEFEAAGGDPPDSIAFLRRVDAAPADLADDRLLGAAAVVHVASASAALVAELCAEMARLLAPAVTPHVLGGVVRPTSFTGNAMHDFAYAHRVLQQPGPAAPNAFLVPMSKTPAWWEKGWMERHTYFLPRYDDSGRMVAEGHALASAAGIACLMRRTYKHPTEPAPPGNYDFITYFECADAAVPTFHQVCAALRDVTRNPEWQFVREGPTWHGRRVATWEELCA